MTGSAVAVRDQPQRLELEQLKYIANTTFIPPGLRGNLPAILACVATGREIGIGDMQALRHIFVTNDGKVGMSAELMVAQARKAGHSISGTFNEDNTACTVRGKRGDNGDEFEFTWTTEMAKNAGLLGKDSWKKYQAALLWARGATQVCRVLFPDVLGGVTHSREELEAVDPPRREQALAGPPTFEDDPDSHPISAAQRTRLWAMVSERKIPTEDYRRLVHRVTGQPSTKHILREQYDELCALVEAYAPSGEEPEAAAPVSEPGPSEAPSSPELSAEEQYEAEQSSFAEMLPESVKRPASAP